MDLVDYKQEVFDEIVAKYSEFASRLEVADLKFIPISALHGDNVVDASQHMPWYKGPSLLYTLETVYIGSDANHVDPRFPVQTVIRPNSTEYHDFRGFAGRVAGGVFKVGDEVLALPSGFTSTIKSLHSSDGETNEIFSPMSATITLEDEIDISRGDMIVKPANQPHISQDVEAMLCWFSDKKLQPNGKYILRHTTKEVKGVVKAVRYKVDINTLHKIETAPEIGMNDIGRIQLRTASPLFFDGYRRNRNTGSLILIDEQTNATVGAGMILWPDSNEASPASQFAEMGGL
jgi:sulfate adenylyltransferase subunit 1